MSNGKLSTKSTKAGHDRGAVLLWFSVMAVAMLGMGALVVDTGALYSERRQLQNGADAAALAVATECAFRTCSTTDAQSVAQTYANLNSQDGASAIAELCGRASGLTLCATPPLGVGSAEYVHVRTQTLSGSGGNEVKYLFAPVLDAANVGGTVNAQATVAWGVPASVPALPILISECEFNRWRDSGYADEDVLFTLDGSDTCGIPGGFAFLNETGPTATCEIRQITLQNGSLNLDDANSGNYGDCSAKIKSLYDAGTPVTVPVYFACDPCTGGAVWTIGGFISIELCGYAFGPQYGRDQVTDQCSNDVCLGPINQNTYRLCGSFTRLSLDNVSIGDGRDYGTRVIKMIG